MHILFQTLIKFTYQLFFIKMPPDKNYFLHTVSIFIIPIPQQAGLLTHYLHQFFFRCRSIP